MKNLFAALALSIALSASAATPTFAQINTEIEAGHLIEARVMMDEVLRKRPESVKAHAINASLLAAEAKPLDKIREELAVANKLKGSVEYPKKEYTKQPVVEEKVGVARYIMLALCAVAGIIASFLGWQYLSIKGKRKNKQIINPEKPEGEINEPIQETDRNLYSVALSHHGNGKSIA